MRLRSLADVARLRARYVNRAIGTGTRVLLDELLAQAGLDASALAGYERGETSHAAVAHAVASGQADAGLGLESAAHAEGASFVPLVHERYHLACLKSALDQPAMQALLTALRSETWQHLLGTLPGYDTAASGEVQSLRALLPWWTFPREKKHSR
jgi:putative molybdopterin biosynthesis protein